MKWTWLMLSPAILAGCDAARIQGAAPNLTAAIAPQVITVKVGETASVTAGLFNPHTGDPSQDHTPGPAGWTWTTDPNGVATVSAAPLAKDAVVTGAKAGQTTLRATYRRDGLEIGASAVVNVVELEQIPASLNFSPGSMEISIGESGGKFSCSAVDQAGVPMTAVLTWTSSAPGVAEVDNSGGIKAVSPGTATITCRQPLSGLTKTGVVTVHARTLLVSASSVIVGEGETRSLSLSMRNFRGAAITFADFSTMTYSSADNSIATAAYQSPGSVAVTGVKAGGPVQITVRTKEGDASVSFPATVTAVTGCRNTTTINYGVTVASDPGGHAGPIGMGSSKSVTITVTPPSSPSQSASIEASGPAPFITVRGIVAQNNCALIATGFGTVAGIQNVKAELSGTYNAAGKLVLTYKIGVNGELPGGQPITYTFTQP